MNPTNYVHCNHIEKGMNFLRIGRGNYQTLSLWGKSMCRMLIPFWLAHLPLSYPTTTIKSSVVSWGSYGWGVECGRIASPYPHAHSTSRLTLMLVRKPPPPSLHADSPLSPQRCCKHSRTFDSPFSIVTHSHAGKNIPCLMQRILFPVLVSRS